MFHINDSNYKPCFDFTFVNLNTFKSSTYIHTYSNLWPQNVRSK